MTEAEPTETLRTFLNSVQPGEVRMATVAGFDGFEVIVDLEGALPGHASIMLRTSSRWDSESPLRCSMWTHAKVKWPCR
jgi:hypothetical protein